MPEPAPVKPAEHLTLRHRPAAPRRLVDLMADDRTGAGALTELTGMTLEELTAGWHEWLLRGRPGE